jgi:hypothetical protein
MMGKTAEARLNEIEKKMGFGVKTVAKRGGW